MTLRWPFITRATLRETVADKDDRIAELKRELAEARSELRQLSNQFTWRATGIALNPELLPEAYRPKAGAPSSDSESSPLTREVPTGMEKVRQQTGTTNVRANLRAIEQSRQQMYDLSGLAEGLVTQKPLTEEHKMRIVKAAAEQATAVADLTKGIEELHSENQQRATGA